MRKFTPQEINKIIELYTKELQSSRQIGKIFNCRHKIILEILKQNKIERRDQLNCRISSGYDRSYFETINTEEKAYFLGLLYADGCNTGRCFSISLQEGDARLIYKLQEALKAKKLKLIKRKRSKSHHQNMIGISITSAKMSQDLIKLGCIPNKSLTLKFPNKCQVSQDLLHHFIRGYFDGDGCISLTKQKPSRKFKTERTEGVVNITGSTDFCDILKKIMLNLGIGFCDVKRFKDINCVTLCAGGTFNLLKFYNFIYKNASIYMERKKKKFDELFALKNYKANGSKKGRGKSKYRGVYIKTVTKRGKTYSYIHAMVKHENEFFKLGKFTNEIDAAKAYDKKAFEIRGQKAILNFPEDYPTFITKNNLPKTEETVTI